MNDLPAADRRSDSRPTRLLVALYLVLATPPLLLPGRPASWAWWLALHAVAALLAWPPPALGRLLEAAANRRPRAARLFLDWYPLLLVPVLYTELGNLIPAIHGSRYFDSLIQQVEVALFGGFPSRDFAVALPQRWFSELMHGGYLSYYFLIYVPPIALYASGRRAAAIRVMFSIILTYALHYLVFIHFPVQGPYYEFQTPVPGAAAGPLYRLTHGVLEAGASRGAAFPSSHVGVAVAQVLATGRFHPRAGLLLAPLALLLALGAVYGGYHYATDAVCGALLGTVAVVAAPAAYRALGGDWRGAGPRT